MQIRHWLLSVVLGLADAVSRIDWLAPLLAHTRPTAISAIAPHTQIVKVSPKIRNAQITLAATVT